MQNGTCDRRLSDIQAIYQSGNFERIDSKDGLPPCEIRSKAAQSFPRKVWGTGSNLSLTFCVV